MTIVTLGILLLSAASVLARDNGVALGGNAVTASPQQPGPTDRAELEAFLDELLAKQMAERHIAGAAVSVVRDGKVLLAKGYGYADVDKKIPVDAETTIFRIGSVTKLFTWTAVMQLLEQGKLDLNADINTYLDFRIPDTYPQSITLKNLFTHTDGFEERFYEALVLDEDDMMPPGQWLASHVPARVRPPGEVAAYSNYGASLAGYIVGKASGKPWDQYIQENILDPLGMAHTSAASLTPSRLRADVTVGYTYKDGAFHAFPDYLGQPGLMPAGGIQSTAADMARFMIAHLEDGLYSDGNIAGARILGASAARKMHSRLFSHDPRLLGTTYGFFEFSENGQRTIGHSGESHPINSLLLLLPDQRLGVFVTYNSEGGGKLVNQHLGFQRAFFDHYFPARAVDPIQPPAGFAKRANRFVGVYKSTRSSYTTLEKVLVLMGSTVEIRNPGDGTLLIATPWGDWHYVEVEPLYFRQVDRPFGMVFREDGSGRIRLFTDYTPMFAFEKLTWHETPRFNMALLLFCALAFLSTIPVLAIRMVWNRRRSRDRNPAPRVARAALWILVSIAVLNLLFLLGTMQWGNPRPLFGVSTIYKFVLGLGVLAAVLTVGAIIYTMLAWKNSYWGRVTRAYYTLVTVAAVAFVWLLNCWNLLGWRF